MLAARSFIVLCLFTAVIPGSLSTVFASERMEQSRPYLGTMVKATVCVEPGHEDRARAALGKVWQRFEDIHGRMNAFDSASEISLLNGAGGREVKVHDDVHALLERSKEYAAMTSGVFDISVGPLMVLWKKAGKDNALPSMEAIRAAKAMVGVHRMKLLDQGRVVLPKGMRVDLGGAASGFAADEAVRILRAEGFRDFLVDAGGEIFAAGEACEGRPWHVGVSDPEGKGRMRGVVRLKDRSVSTSGSYEKFVVIKGERWPHIVNPVTGFPARGVVSATVIAPLTVDADVLSTALCILGPGPGLRLIESLGEGYAAMIMTEAFDGSLVEHATKGYAAFKAQ